MNDIYILFENNDNYNFNKTSVAVSQIKNNLHTYQYI